MPASPRLLHAALAASLFAGCAGAEPVVDPATAAPQRTLLERHPLSGVPEREVIIGTVHMPAGGVAGWHYHDGDEAGYITRGTMVLHQRGQPDRVLKTGDTFFNPRGLPHSITTVPGSDGGDEVSTWIVDRDKPFATPVTPP